VLQNAGFYQAAASLFGVLLLTGVVAELRVARDREPDSRRSRIRAVYGFVALTLVVLVGEFASLTVLLNQHSSRVLQLIVGVALIVGILGVTGLALLSIIRPLIDISKLRRRAVVAGSFGFGTAVGVAAAFALVPGIFHQASVGSATKPSGAAQGTRVMNASGGIYWRSAPDWNTPEKNLGSGVYPSTRIQVVCYEMGAANVPGSQDGMWERARWVSGPGSGSGWINEHFIDDGSPFGFPSRGVPACA
jgi:MFS family permease